MSLQHQIDVRLRRGQIASRRDFLRTTGVAVATAGVVGWTDRIGLAASELRQRGKACILLWMAGGPSQFETFDPKGGTESTATSVPGIHIADRLPEVAKSIDDWAIIRSMTSKEGSHPRASYYMHHGYLPMGGVKFPSLGANVAERIGAESIEQGAMELPSFVRIGGRGQQLGGGGFLGVDYDPLVLKNASKPPNNSRPMTSRDRYERRLGLLHSLETDFGRVEGADVVAEHRKLVAAASEMILSPSMQAFDIDREPESVRKAYGKGDFADGCLLARRLIDSGVTFVEVNLGGWDTHQENDERTAELCGKIDRPMAALTADLKSRGMLDDTLVVWMGEFGRTPKINPRGGRDHYPRAFSAAMAGCGIAGGHVIGATDEQGARVAERPVTPKDLYQSIYTALGIDPEYENIGTGGRPIKLVDKGAVVEELFA